ncbi:uncharacterized protein BDW70DRAFT_131635 [Aspergillus foveolatus]|uniref:uncharacterized protein n=1 Tax=Aspergillus foveolatus TaxID=210207 RepID=UPI003CCDF17C
MSTLRFLLEGDSSRFHVLLLFSYFLSSAINLYARCIVRSWARLDGHLKRQRSQGRGDRSRSRTRD